MATGSTNRPPGSEQRREWIVSALQSAHLDAVVCGLPRNVLMLSGYWPMLGKSIAIATQDGRIALLAPEGDQPFLSLADAHLIRTYPPGSLERLITPVQAVLPGLRELFSELGLQNASLGIETRPYEVPIGYSAIHIWNHALKEAVLDAATGAMVMPADWTLSELSAVKTGEEIAHIKHACAVAQDAFLSGASGLAAGLSETQTAGLFRFGLPDESVNKAATRADGFVWVMSGPNSALAGAAFARSKSRLLRKNEPVLVHCNSYVNGYWTDITRTFFLGEPEGKLKE